MIGASLTASGNSALQVATGLAGPYSVILPPKALGLSGCCGVFYKHQASVMLQHL